ncbi:MAG TPA: hypothetical protein VI299_28885 [Polyangiales bacterium]
MNDHHAAARRLICIVALLTTSSARAGEVPPQTLPSVQEAPAPGPTQAAAAWVPPHYDRGVVLLMAAEPASVPYRLKLNHVSQFKYTNTLHVDPTYVDHLGNERTVQRRNDIQLTRDVFYFSGYVFDRRLDFNILLYTSSATLSATAAGYVGWVFHKSFALRAGFFSLPSMRSMTGTYPFFQGTDRSMFVNYMRPGFTQGVWAEGEPLAGLHYIAMVGNSMNTLDIAAVKIDNKFVYGATVWYDLNDFDRAWNDYEHHERPALRIGGAFTYGQEDRLSDLSTASPENNATFISDGRLLFEAGALAPGVTVDLATIHLWAADVGVKYRGLAFNAEVAWRWLSDFRANGALPLRSIFDWGFEASLGYFVVPRRLDAYARASLVDGSFVTSYEEGGGLNFYPVSTRQVWLNVEVMGIHRSPYGGVLYAYSAGQSGTLVQSQLLLRF